MVNALLGSEGRGTANISLIVEYLKNNSNDWLWLW